eukprot:g19571.t1
MLKNVVHSKAVLQLRNPFKLNFITRITTRFFRPRYNSKAAISSLGPRTVFFKGLAAYEQLQLRSSTHAGNTLILSNTDYLPLVPW